MHSAVQYSAVLCVFTCIYMEEDERSIILILVQTSMHNSLVYHHSEVYCLALYSFVYNREYMYI